MTFRYQLRRQKTRLGGINVARQPHDPGRWSNPYRIKPHGPYERAESIRLYREDLMAGRLRDPKTSEVLTVAPAIVELRGHPLGCFCGLNQECHADVLLALVNAPLCEEIAT
jgi:Domain of unknown function (DUF4326)